jgi:hypothetical protein
MGVKFNVNWEALQAVGVNPKSPVSVSLKDVPFRKALTTVLAIVGDKTAISYEVRDGAITISTKDDLHNQGPVVVKVFDIRDFLVGNPATTPAEADKMRQDLVDNLIKTIEETVWPDSWTDRGGKIGSIRQLNGQLIVNQNMENQKAIFALLQQLREPRRFQVAVEARMYLLDDDTFKALALTKPQNVAGPTTAPGALPSGEFVSNIIPEKQLDALLKKLQGSPNASMLTAPRVTLFNGQRGFIANTTSYNYIAGWNTQRNANGIDVLVPETRTLDLGVVFNVSATVAADRKNVVMALRLRCESWKKLKPCRPTPCGDRRPQAPLYRSPCCTKPKSRP